MQNAQDSDDDLEKARPGYRRRMNVKLKQFVKMENSVKSPEIKEIDLDSPNVENPLNSPPQKKSRPIELARRSPEVSSTFHEISALDISVKSTELTPKKRFFLRYLTDKMK